MNFINFLVVLLLALCSGGGAAAILQGVFSRKGRRADEAKSVADVATSVNQMYIGLQTEMREIKRAVIGLTDKLDDYLPKIAAGEPLTRDEAAALREANNRLKLVA